MSSSASSHTLLADLGGTNVRFGLADCTQSDPLLLDTVRRYRVKDFGSLAEAIRQYHSDTGLTAKKRGHCRCRPHQRRRNGQDHQ